MNATEFALKLIENYNTEQNRYRRANAAMYRLQTDKQWQHETATVGIATFYYKKAGLSNREAYNTFLNRQSSSPIDTAFISHSIKSGKIRKYNTKLAQYRAALAKGFGGSAEYYPTRIKEVEAAIEKVKKTPVYASLGKKWRQIVSAQSAADKAYKRRWEARCAITSFNKLQSEIKIKFGSCGRGQGSMSTIHHIVIDGDKIRLAKFLDNARFETAILNG